MGRHRIVLKKRGFLTCRNVLYVFFAVALRKLNNRTLVPVHFISDGLSLKVDWNSNNALVTLTSE
ncbi:stalk domain-containing protein [Paenibacillus sp. JJ-100]|uniref:stalk domain-containing protein n=1 Tax=Paenibacillus sp. JJ-100 TaxID=2974896 RepID=UPI00232D821C|nr:stalk domain-containing protein [Paenibacillus sp. JJ-100]